MKSKIMSLLVVLTLILSGFLVMNTYDLGIVETAKGVRLAGASGNLGGDYILSNDGSGGNAAKLTCGELITLYINNNTLDPDQDYTVWFYNGSQWKELDVDGDDSADQYGDLVLSFHVPGWTDVGNSSVPKSPLENSGDTGLSNGQYNITLATDGSSGARVFSTMNITITIGSLYDVRYKYNDNWIDNLVYNTSYSEFNFYIYNWTGSTWEVESDDDFDLTLYKADESTVEVQTSTPITTGYWIPDFAINEDDVTASEYEVFYWVNVTQNVSGTAQPLRHSYLPLPLLLNMTADVSSNLEWGDTIDISGYVLDGENQAVEAGYTVALYVPVMGKGGNYTAITTTTYSTGRYSLSVETGTDQSYAAGTWYLGTYGTFTDRVQLTTIAPYQANFIPYTAFVVDTKDDAKLDVENTDDIIVDFNQTINVSVYNSSWMDNYEFRNMQIHVTGLNGWNETLHKEYDEDDYVLVDFQKRGTSNNDYCYYEFQYHFNDTGTATIVATWPGNGTSIAGEDVGEGMDGTYGNTFGNASTSIMANISGTTTFSVAAANEMNLVIEGGTMVESVTVNDASCGSGKINGSQWFSLLVYADAEDEPMNATIEITGCGLDITIDEDDPTDSDYCSHHNWTTDVQSLYRINIAPKIAGTLTITVTNETEGTSVSQDYTITGLVGTVTTSVGDDLKITVDTTETITATITNGQYADLYLTLFDYQWNCVGRINYTDGDGTAGEGLNGVFTFIPDVDDLEHVGHIVVAGVAGTGNWMFDVIEVAPIYDLTVELVTPSLENATPSLTCGLQQDVVVKLLDDDGNEVDEDSPSVVGKLIDEDHDEDNPLQTFDFSSSGGNWEYDDLQPYWSGQLVITGTNDTGETEHSGNLTLDVEMATITYSPTAYTAGIGTTNVTLTVTGVDANGDPLPDNTRLYFWVNESNTFTWSTNNYCNLDEGVGEVDIEDIGDNQTFLNATFENAQPNQGNRTLGMLDIFFPTFELNPDTVFIGQSNMVTITATDHEGSPIEGINLTFLSSIPGILSAQPDPVQTNADGIAQLSINPLASGKLNVTIARNIAYEDGQLNWSNAVKTDTYLTATSIQQMKISLSKSPIYEGETLTVTVTSGTNTLADVDVEFGETTVKTDSNGQAVFTVPDPGVESAVYTVTAEKSGYVTAEKSITVIKIWDITIIAPSSAPAMGEEFTITVLAKGAPLAGATVEFNGKTYTSGADGKLTITAPDSAGDYTLTASYEDYTDATVTITIKEGGGIPGFELLTLVAALGVAFILLRRRR